MNEDDDSPFWGVALWLAAVLTASGFLWGIGFSIVLVLREVFRRLYG